MHYDFAISAISAILSKNIIVIPNNDSRAFLSVDVKFRSCDQDLYDSKLNSIAVILFPKYCDSDKYKQCDSDD